MLLAVFFKKVITLFRTIPVDPVSCHVYCRGEGGGGGEGVLPYIMRKKELRG